MRTKDDEERTPVETPSAMLRLGIEPCPACAGRGFSLVGEKCFYCEGGRRVTNEKADKWRAAHRDTDPMIPAVKDPEKKA